MKNIVKGFKVFNSDWTCRGFQYEVGKTFETRGTPKCCERGFHFCTELVNCFSYYDFDPTNKVAEIEAIGEIDGDGNGKSCTNKIRIVKELSWKEVLEMVNIGIGNSGLCNTGNRNTGNYNTGNRNTGDYNAGDCNSGYFNSTTPKVRLFNRETEYDFNSNEIYRLCNILSYCPQSYRYSDFILKEKMTEEEIEKHPECETIGGYLKIITVEPDKQKWWDEEVDDSDKEFIKALPHFDADVFYQCVGVRV